MSNEEKEVTEPERTVTISLNKLPKSVYDTLVQSGLIPKTLRSPATVNDLMKRVWMLSDSRDPYETRQKLVDEVMCSDKTEEEQNKALKELFANDPYPVDPVVSALRVLRIEDGSFRFAVGRSYRAPQDYPRKDYAENKAKSRLLAFLSSIQRLSSPYTTGNWAYTLKDVMSLGYTPEVRYYRNLLNMPNEKYIYGWIAAEYVDGLTSILRESRGKTAQSKPIFVVGDESVLSPKELEFVNTVVKPRFSRTTGV